MPNQKSSKKKTQRISMRWCVIKNGMEFKYYSTISRFDNETYVQSLALFQESYELNLFSFGRNWLNTFIFGMKLVKIELEIYQKHITAPTIISSDPKTVAIGDWTRLELLQRWSKKQ